MNVWKLHISHASFDKASKFPGFPLHTLFQNSVLNDAMLLDILHVMHLFTSLQHRQSDAQFMSLPSGTKCLTIQIATKTSKTVETHLKWITRQICQAWHTKSVKLIAICSIIYILIVYMIHYKNKGSGKHTYWYIGWQLIGVNLCHLISFAIIYINWFGETILSIKKSKL